METKIWNITDAPASPVPAQSRMVLGRVIKPGRSLRVTKDRLVNAHKLMADVEAGLLYIGNVPPKAYVAVKRPPRAKLAAGVGRARVLPGTVVPAEPVSYSVSDY